MKIIALAIFAIDWWLVRRRRQMDKLKPLNVNDPVIGSIISLDKCKFNTSFFNKINIELFIILLIFIFMYNFVVVFEEKLSHNDAANHMLSFKRFGTDTVENQFRHSRNNSRTIQLEYG